MWTLRSFGVAVLAAASAQSCQPPSNSGAPVPAVLAEADEASLDALRAALAEAMARAEVALGAEDPTQSSVISVLPPPLGPLEDRSPALPTRFALVLQDETCAAVRIETGERFALDGVRCAPAPE